MKLPFCVACSAKDDLQHHHLVTRAEGGSNKETNLITLCAACHHKLHQRYMDGTYNHGERVRSGQAQARAKGTKSGKAIGHPFALDHGERRKVAEQYAAGMTMQQLSIEYEVGIGTIHRVLNARPFEGASGAAA
jgi:hypothetical protein